MFSLWETFGITTAASLLGFLSMCVPFATKETGVWNWKGLPYRIFRQHCWMRTRVLQDAAIFHYVGRWLPWPPSKGQTAARSLLVHFARGQRCCLAAQHPVLKTLLANHGFPASVLGKQLYPLPGSVLICLVQEATDLLTTNLQSPLKTFPKLFLDDGHLPWPHCSSPGLHLRCVSPRLFSKVRLALPNSERHRFDAKKTLGEHGSCQRSAGLLTACIGSRCFKNLLPNFWDCRVYRSLV